MASVLAEGGPTIGASYEWIDNNVSDGVLYYYWLEEVEQDGDTELWGPKATTSDPPLFLDLGLGSVAIQELGNGDYEVYVTAENNGTVQVENFPIGLAVSPLGGNGLIYFRTCIDQLDPGQSITKHFLVTVPFDVLIAQVNPDGGEIPPTCPHLGGEIDDGHENNSRLYDLDNISCPPGLALPDNHAVANATTTLFWGKCTASTQYELQITQLNDGALLTIPMGDYFSFPLGIVNPAFFQSRQQYSWKVRACSAGNCSNWSEERTFWWLESPPEIIFVHPPFLARDEESPQPLRITIQARDADNPQLTWSIENIGGTDIGGMNLMSNGRSAIIEWSPNETQGPSTNDI